ncbi:MAG TPA: gamma-glutamylcyclotransferase family protein [Solirubrobacterales bacterium]|nr:gamma-glutamylcyclotransferase family protein [Solirubrobacterales bacterium]
MPATRVAPTANRAGDGPMRLAVFGYGSLVSRASIAETLGHEAPAPIPARLAGWRRRWSIYRVNTAHEKVFERVDGEPFEHVVGLNIERATDAPEAEWPNGALIELTEEQLERLDRREVRYDRVEVEPGAAITDDPHGFDRVFAFTAKEGHFAAETPPSAIIMAAYVGACEAAFNELGPSAWEEFLATTGEFPAPVVEARLVEDSIPEGNPRAW